jgi:hypothetical protein
MLYEVGPLQKAETVSKSQHGTVKGKFVILVRGSWAWVIMWSDHSSGQRLFG